MHQPFFSKWFTFSRGLLRNRVVAWCVPGSCGSGIWTHGVCVQEQLFSATLHNAYQAAALPRTWFPFDFWVTCESIYTCTVQAYMHMPVDAHACECTEVIRGCQVSCSITSHLIPMRCDCSPDPEFTISARLIGWSVSSWDPPVSASQFRVTDTGGLVQPLCGCWRSKLRSPCLYNKLS